MFGGKGNECVMCSVRLVGVLRDHTLHEIFSAKMARVICTLSGHQIELFPLSSEWFYRCISITDFTCGICIGDGRFLLRLVAAHPSQPEVGGYGDIHMAYQ